MIITSNTKREINLMIATAILTLIGGTALSYYTFVVQERKEYLKSFNKLVKGLQSDGYSAREALLIAEQSFENTRK